MKSYDGHTVAGLAQLLDIKVEVLRDASDDILAELADSSIVPATQALMLVEAFGPSMLLIRGRAEAGAAWLDRRIAGWRDRVTAPVDMDSSYFCVLAQAYQMPFRDAASVTGLTASEAWVLGFEVAPQDERRVELYIFLLGEAWKPLLSGS